MKFLLSPLPSLLLAVAGMAQAASSWGVGEAMLSISSGQGRGGKPAYEYKLSDNPPLSKPVALRSSEKLKLLITTTEGGMPKRPHQAFLLVQDQDTGLETAFPFTTKDNGKGLLEFTQKDLPLQFLHSPKPLAATLVIGSFGPSEGYSHHILDLDLLFDAESPRPNIEMPLRYGKLPEIHHIFKEDPKSAPIVISVFFVLAILATVPILLGTWAYLGANLNHLQKSLSTAPISHALFFGSVLSMEGIFFLYYYSWTLFQMLPAAGVVGLVAFVSGSKALSEVQARRVAGER